MSAPVWVGILACRMLLCIDEDEIRGPNRYTYHGNSAIQIHRQRVMSVAVLHWCCSRLVDRPMIEHKYQKWLGRTPRASLTECV